MAAAGGQLSRGHQQVDTRGLILCSSLFLTHTNHHPTRVIGSLSSPDRYQSLRWTILNFYQRRRHDRKHAPFARLNGRHNTTSRAIEKKKHQQKKIPGKISFDLAPKRRRVLRAAAVAALLNAFGLGGCLRGGGWVGQDESDEEEEDRRLGWCLNGVVDIRRKDGRIRRPLPLLPSVDGVPIASTLRDLEPNFLGFCCGLFDNVSNNVHQSL